MASNTRNQLEAWLKTIEPVGRVLDVGGLAIPVKGRTKTWDVEEYKILDFAVPYLVRQNPDYIFLDVNKNVDREALAYIAGIVDGEGCISAAKKGDIMWPLFSMNMNDHHAFEVIKEVFDFEYHKPDDNSDMYRISIGSTNLVMFLQALYPYLRIKKPQAALALQMRQEMAEHPPERIHRGGSTVDEASVERRWRAGEMIKTLNHCREHFDTAFVLEVAEYWFDPLTALKTVASMLKPGGRLYISTHFLFPAHSGGEDYMRYTRKGICRLLTEAGYEIESVVPRMANSAALAVLLDKESKVQRDRGEIGHLVTAYKP